MTSAPLRRLASAALAAVLVGGTAVASTPTDAPVGGHVARGPLDAAGPMEPVDDWFAGQRVTGDLSRGDLQARARRQALAMRKTTRALAPELAEAEWALEGPINIGGRVTDLAVHPTDPTLVNTVWTAAASGGVWRSDDAGMTWEPSWPDHFPQAIGALAMGGVGTLWAGTGEANPGGGSIVFGGEGVFRSTDLGETWEMVGLPDSGAIGRIAVDPTDPDRVLVAASGDLYNPGGERGLYETRDGGETWELVLAPENDTTGAVDLAIDPSDPDKVFVTMWDHFREPDLRRYGGPGSGLYVTTDGGESWEQVTGGGYAEDEELGRIGVAIAPSAPNVVYSIVITPEGPFEGFYRSLDGGATWQKTEEGANVLGLLGFSQSTYGWWFGRIFVDPVDPLHILVAGLILVQSFDGGLTQQYVANVHADQHAAVWHPLVPNRVYLGNDGGVYRHDNRGFGPNWIPAVDEPWTQHYSVNISQQDPSRLVSGLQDNGVNRNYGGLRNPQELPLGAGVNVPVPDVVPGDGPVPNPTGGVYWNEYNGGDGLAARIHPGNHDIVFGCSQYGNCSRNVQGGDTGGSASFMQAAGSRRGWYMPLEFDPTNPDVMYAANEYVSRSTDQGASWQTISDDLGYGIDDDYEDEIGRDPNYAFGTVTTVEAAHDEATVWAGTDNGLLWVTRDLGEDGWVDLYHEDLPRMWITRIAVDPQDPATAYVTFSGFRQGDDDAVIVRVRHLGGTDVEVTDISGDLPDAPLHDVLVLEDRLVVASDVGVFTTLDGGATWLVVGENLPMAPVMELAWNEEADVLAAATFGRGVWSVVLP